MSTSNQEPNQAEETNMNNNNARKPRYDTLLVGIVMIGLGVTLLIATLNPGYDLRSIFFTWWPILLVGAGLAKVLQALSGGPSHKSGIGWLVFAAFLLFLLSSDRVGNLEDIGFNWGLPFKDLITETSSTVDVEEQNKLVLDVRRTDVTLIGTDDEDMEIIQKVYGRMWDRKKQTIDLEMPIDLTEEEGLFKYVSRPDDLTKDGLTLTVRLEIRLPKSMEVEFIGEFSDINARDLDAAITVNSSDADVYLSEMNGFVDVTLVSGDVELDDMNMGLSLNGKRLDIELTEIYGNTVIDVERSSIDLVNYRQQDGDLEISTTRGSIELELNRRSGFQLDADADGGRVEFDFGSREITRRTAYKVTIGEEGHLVKLRTRGGSITVEEQ